MEFSLPLSKAVNLDISLVGLVAVLVTRPVAVLILNCYVLISLDGPKYIFLNRNIMNTNVQVQGDDWWRNKLIFE